MKKRKNVPFSYITGETPATSWSREDLYHQLINHKTEKDTEKCEFQY